MKRCSECDFIYEDEQHLCDMDGQELVYEPTIQSLQLSTAIPATELPASQHSSRVRQQALAAAVAVLIATVLSVGYSGFTSQYAPQTIKAPTSNVITTPQLPPIQTPATPAVSPTPTPSQSPQLEKTKPTVRSPRARPSTSFRSTVARQETVTPQPPSANHKKESGLGGFLKKTGKVLKRPFKF